MCLASIVMTEVRTTSIVPFATAPAEVTHSAPAPERLLSGDPKHVVRNFFSDATGQFFAGVWESTPGRWRVSDTEEEFCCITKGRVRLEDGRGRSSRGTPSSCRPASAASGKFSSPPPSSMQSSKPRSSANTLARRPRLGRYRTRRDWGLGTGVWAEAPGAPSRSSAERV